MGLDNLWKKPNSEDPNQKHAPEEVAKRSFEEGTAEWVGDWLRSIGRDHLPEAAQNVAKLLSQVQARKVAEQAGTNTFARLSLEDPAMDLYG